MQAGVADIVAVAEAGAQLRAAVLDAGVVIWAFRHIDAPDAAAGLQLGQGEASCRAEIAVRVFRKLLDIAVDGLQRLVLRQDGLQRFIGRDARQDLALQMPLLFLAVSGVFCQQRAPP